MLKKTLLLSVILISMVNCRKENSSKNPPVSTAIQKSNTEIQSQKSQDHTAIETVKSFLKWYRGNEEKLNQFSTVKGGMAADTNEATNYYIDFNEVKKELNFLKSSHLFSPNFLTAYEKRYSEGSEYFKQNPANDGPPVNFDYNYFFLTQEDYQSDLKEASHLQFTVKPINDQQCYVEFHLEHCGMTLRYILVKKDQWLIDAIENIS